MAELRILEDHWPSDPGGGLVSGLIGAYVGLQNRALLTEIRKELAELETRIITWINGTYVCSGEWRSGD